MRIGIEQPVTHIAVGQTIRLKAFREYSNYGSVNAESSSQGPLRKPINPQWSESDECVASVNLGGLLTALKTGQVTVKGTWNGYTTLIKVKVVKELPVGPLPKFSAQVSTTCMPQTIDLSLDPERKIQFRLRFNREQCSDVAVNSTAPDVPLPWEFEFVGGKLVLTGAHKSVVDGRVILNGAGEITFTAWSEGEGRYPLSLSGKSVMMVGDSMVEGLGPFLKKKIEAAGGKLYWEPWYSSTTIQWQESKRLTEMIEKHSPDIIFIALGSNEIFIPKQEPRAAAVRSLVEEIGRRPAYWIGPPCWKPDQGIVHSIEKNFQTGHFFNSSNLILPRRRDGAHPTPEGAEQWANIVWNWYSDIY